MGRDEGGGDDGSEARTMRAERRHELKENDLEHYLAQGRAYLDKNGKRIGLIVVAAGVVFVAATLFVRSQAAEAEGQWLRKSELSFADTDAGRKSIDALGAMAEGSTDAPFAMACLMEQGQEALRLSATGVPFPPDRELNDKARQAFTALLGRFPQSPVAVGTARLGLATAEENDYILDGKADHKAEAAKQIEAVIADPHLDGLPYKRLALSRQKRLDAVFSPMHFQPPSTEELETAAKAIEEATTVGPPAPAPQDQPNVDTPEEPGTEAPDPAPSDPGHSDSP